MKVVAGWLGVVSMLALAVTGCSDSGAAGSGSVIEANSAIDLVTPKVLTPIADGAVGVSPADPIPVRVDNGKLTAVTLFTPDGTPVAGQIAPDGTSWQLTEQLGFNRRYRLQAEAVGIGGTTSTAISFTTLAPRNKTHPWLLPGENEVVGIGQPVAIQFDENIPDRHAAQDAIKITTTPAVEGAFYWVNNREVRWRPEHFWAPGTKVTVDVNTYGRDLGSGLIGDSDIHSSFTIGDPMVFTADDNTKMVTVYENGQVIKEMPTSMGMGGTETIGGTTLSFWTQPGTYTVMDKANPVIMDSSTYGLPINSRLGYKESINWATRISTDGIYLHELESTVWAQGNTDTSHGCLNLSAANAKWFFDFSQPGDVVEIKNTGGAPLEVWQNGDWTLSWADWAAGSALA